MQQTYSIRICWRLKWTLQANTFTTHTQTYSTPTQGEVKGIWSIAQSTAPFKAISMRIDARGIETKSSGAEMIVRESVSVSEAQWIYRLPFQGPFPIHNLRPRKLVSPIFPFLLSLFFSVDVWTKNDNGKHGNTDLQILPRAALAKHNI